MNMVGHVCEAIHSLKVIMLMVVLQVAFAVVNIFYKLALNDGMSSSILVAYRLIFATAFMAPLALIFERKNRPMMTWTVLIQAFWCGLLGGSLSQNLYLESLALTSATYATAMANLVPAITFVLAVSFRLEKLNFGSLAGKAKVMGTLIAIGGAMLLTFYKGVDVNIWSTHVNLLHNPTNIHTSHQNKLLGTFLALATFIAYALWLIIQAKMSERYPCHFSSTALMSFMGSLQAVVYAICKESDWEQWKLGWNIRLLTISYSGIVASGVCTTLVTWCVRMRGPLFVSAFNPLMLVVVALVASLLLDEKLHLGSILGGGLIVIGLYAVLWGKGKEMKRMSQLMPSNDAAESSEPIEVVITTKMDEENNNNNSSSSNNKGLTETYGAVPV